MRMEERSGAVDHQHSGTASLLPSPCAPLSSSSSSLWPPRLRFVPCSEPAVQVATPVAGTITNNEVNNKTARLPQSAVPVIHCQSAVPVIHYDNGEKSKSKLDDLTEDASDDCGLQLTAELAEAHEEAPSSQDAHMAGFTIGSIVMAPKLLADRSCGVEEPLRLMEIVDLGWRSSRINFSGAKVVYPTSSVRRRCWWMDGWIVDGVMGGWEDGWMDGGVDGWMDGRMGGWMNGWMDEWIDAWVDAWMEGQMNGRIDWRMNGWMD